MKLLQIFQITLAELFVLVTFVALSCVTLLNASDRMAWMVGGVLWLTLLAAIAGAVTPSLPRRPFFLGFLGAALLHLYLMQYTGSRGQSSYDLDMPTFYLIELMWQGIPTTHWPALAASTGNEAATRTGPAFRLMAVLPPIGMDHVSAAHANFQGIGTQLFSIFYGMLTGFLAQSFTRLSTEKRAKAVA